jgi:hypothetical protein
MELSSASILLEHLTVFKNQKSDLTVIKNWASTFHYESDLEQVFGGLFNLKKCTNWYRRDMAAAKLTSPSQEENLSTLKQIVDTSLQISNGQSKPIIDLINPNLILALEISKAYLHEKKAFIDVDDEKAETCSQSIEEIIRSIKESNIEAGTKSYLLRKLESLKWTIREFFLFGTNEELFKETVNQGLDAKAMESLLSEEPGIVKKYKEILTTAYNMVKPYSNAVGVGKNLFIGYEVAKPLVENFLR